jgi:hypothetical protein
VPADEPTLWRIERFYDRLASWSQSQEPDRHLVAIVEEWIETRADTPHEGAMRNLDFPNLWVARIRHTYQAGSAVFCSFWIFEEERLVRCDNFATLSLPL